ncbi:DUF4139 domain-containing protein [Taibaiella koreensis]|uniref:DUF4139 domain-containing protein n=1 Tax=Taibaiella koreensis TaxID=1268548 RepID=UPI0013C2D288|nr:DUF4139 domain-containing protein [Taibaiella koreensis]
MKTTIITFFCLICFLPAVRAQVSTEATLESVTVYTQGVEMNHKAKITLPAGSSEVVIRNVANVLDENSLRIGAGADVTVLSVSFNKDYMKPKEKSKAYLQLEDSVKRLNKLLTNISSDQQSKEGLLAVLERNGTIAGTNTTVTVAELEKMLDFYGRKQLEVKQQLSVLTEQKDLYEERLDLLQQQMRELTADQQANRGQLVAQVVAKVAASCELNISYVSPNAGWSAFYDLRAENTSSPLKLGYKANITQSTGIDWKRIKLRLATGNPSRNSTAPVLSTWFLRYNNLSAQLRSAMPGVMVSSGGGQPGATSDIQVRGQGNLAAEQDLGEVAIYGQKIDKRSYTGSISMSAADIAKRPVVNVAQAINNMSSYTTPVDNELNATFDVDIPYDIASNAKPHSVSLQEYKLPATYRYYAAPKSSVEAFLTAEITGYEQLNLLPGMANILFENMYIGKSMLNPAVTSDTMSLGLGTDSRIVIKREKVVEQSGVKTLGSNRRQSYTYEIKIRNAKKETVNLLLKDQYPIATDKDMEVELKEASGADADKETGILSWNLKLAPGEAKTVRVSYSVKYPRSYTIANL